MRLTMSRLKLMAQQQETRVVDVYLNGLAASGRKSMLSLLNLSASILQRRGTAHRYDWTQLRYEHVAKVRATLLDNTYAVATVNMALAALKGVAQTAFNLQRLDADSLARIKTVKRVKGDSGNKGRALSREEVKQLLEATKAHPQKLHRLRDKAIILTLCGAGLRVGELVALDIRDYCQRTQTLTVRQGKGRKYRQITVSPLVARAIQAWLKVKNEGNAIFTGICRSGLVNQKALTPAGVTVILSQLAEVAGLEAFTPHDLRRTFITRLLEQGADINIVRQLAGHSDISTTALYDKRCDNTRHIISSCLRF
ncbi:tyrosine-type recombinase/integrase [Salmonella enterica subsp. enterica serovar Nagoya]|nr:site-specific integrase [Salmonella enterica subsp. enterica serovar Nagoya]ECP0317530.1 tyrosine-type recombinase/integrase [Salmonella enterica subsp. enterica]